MRDTNSRLRHAIERMAELRQEVTFADDGDHTNPIVRFRLKQLRASIDGRHRVLIEHLDWGVRATTLKQRRAEEALELKHLHYFGTPVATLATLYAQGRLQPIP